MIDTETGVIAAEAPQGVLNLNSIRALATNGAELVKVRVNTFLLATAWCGYFLAAQRTGRPAIGVGLLHALLGIGMVSCGSAALNEVVERDIDKLMYRTARRPIPAGRVRALDAAIFGSLLILVGAAYLAFFTNPLTGALTLLTAIVYLGAYTPLKRVSPVCTAIGAVPGAMPGVLGWAACAGRLHWGALALFAILFFWQFPHFFSIAWLYRDDYERGGIRMLPVVEPDGRSTAWRIIVYSLVLIPVSLVPTWIGMTGRIYAAAAILLGLAVVLAGSNLARLNQPLSSSLSRARARRLLQATIFYLPALLAFMVLDSLRP